MEYRLPAIISPALCSSRERAIAERRQEAEKRWGDLSDARDLARSGVEVPSEAEKQALYAMIGDNAVTVCDPEHWNDDGRMMSEQMNDIWEALLGEDNLKGGVARFVDFNFPESRRYSAAHSRAPLPPLYEWLGALRTPELKAQVITDLGENMFEWWRQEGDLVSRGDEAHSPEFIYPASSSYIPEIHAAAGLGLVGRWRRALKERKHG